MVGGSAAGWVVVEQPAHQLMLLLPIATGPSLSPLCPRHTSRSSEAWAPGCAGGVGAVSLGFSSHQTLLSPPHLRTLDPGSSF